MAACSSSGGGSGPSTSQLESKLKSEPTIKTALSTGGTQAKVTSQVIDCIAKALKKDADPKDLSKYVQGQLTINDLGGKSKGSADRAKSDTETCVKQAVSADKTAGTK